MDSPVSRILPTRRARRFLSAMRAVMGTAGMNTALHQAGLAHLADHGSMRGLRASEFAMLLQVVESYYGSGARVLLNRVGRAAFLEWTKQPSLGSLGLRLAGVLLPRDTRALWALQQVAAELAAPHGLARAERAAGRLVLVDEAGDAVGARQRDVPICWSTAGEIEEALLWATGVNFEVVEVACRAQGRPACRFEARSAAL